MPVSAFCIVVFVTNRFEPLPASLIPPQTSVRLKEFKQEPSKVKLPPGKMNILEFIGIFTRQPVKLTVPIMFKSPFKSI
jgi:hypothetical protein